MIKFLLMALLMWHLIDIQQNRLNKYIKYSIQLNENNIDTNIKIEFLLF